MPVRLIHGINLSLLAALLLGSAWALPRLPERIPAQFSPGGEVIRWTEASAGSWFLLPLITLAAIAFNYSLAHLLPRRPQLINFPGKPRLLSLPAGRQAPVIARVQDILYWISTFVIVLFGYIQWTTYRSAHGADSERPVLAILLVSLLFMPLALGFWIPRITRELDRQVEADREAHP